MSALPPDMADPQALASFVGKWRARWPEWAVAEAFVPVTERQPALAWFALCQELTDAAWAATDPRPSEVKLAWWAEELQGWAQGRRRHPLGTALQRLPAPWLPLAASLPALLASRERAPGPEQAISTLEPFAAGMAGVAATLFAAAAPAPPPSVVLGLLAEQLLLQGDTAVPRGTRVPPGEAIPSLVAARAWASTLLQRWPPTQGGPIPGRIHAALLRARLRRFAAGGAASQALPYRQVLWHAWRAARA